MDPLTEAALQTANLIDRAVGAHLDDLEFGDLVDRVVEVNADAMLGPMERLVKRA